MDIEDPVSLKPVSDYIDDQVMVPMVRLPASICNPNTNEPLQQQRATAPDLLNHALTSAERLHEAGEWRRLPPAKRAVCLEHMADRLDTEVENIALAEALTTGIVIRQARVLADAVPQVFRLAAAHLREAGTPVAVSDHMMMRRVPWGPAVLIVPWAAGALIAAHKVASALAAGCPVILKPSEWTPHACGYIAEAAADAGLPTGAFQLVHGGEEVAKILVYDARTQVVSFTGSTAVGRSLALACAADFKPLQLELGGVNPLIVLEDGDIDSAAEAVVNAITWCNGQWCRRTSRLLVHSELYIPLLHQVLDRLERIIIGDSLLSEMVMGPLIHDEQRQSVEAFIQMQLSHGGIAHQMGRLPPLPGYFMQPTLITNLNPEYSQDEILGPVISVHMFRNDKEAVALANQPRSAQAASIFGKDTKRARRLSQCLNISSVSINDFDPLNQYPSLPRSGWGVSGSQDAGLSQSIDFFGGIQTIKM